MTTYGHLMNQPNFSLLFSGQQIAERVKELALQIDEDYQGRELVMVAILKGSFLFVADLVRAVQTPTIVDFMRLASYGSGICSSGIVEIRKDLEIDIKGRDVLVVEDIIDTGQTLETLREKLLSRQPASLKVCALIDKTASRSGKTPIDYVGFSMEKGFIIGYGLDLDERYRDLPDIHLLDPNGIS
jgi:hypoxanthine phosphoribosyltransferase